MIHKVLIVNLKTRLYWKKSGKLWRWKKGDGVWFSTCHGEVNAVFHNNLFIVWVHIGILCITSLKILSCKAPEIVVSLHE